MLMDKNCGNCTHKLFSYHTKFCTKNEIEPVNHICDKYIAKCCSCSNEASYKYADKFYCEVCLLEKCGVVKNTITNYYWGFTHLGDSKDIEEVIKNLASEIREEIEVLE